MEGICDMFAVEEEGQPLDLEQETDYITKNEYKLKPIRFECPPALPDLTIYEIDGKEDSVLIGQAHWRGSKVMSKWLAEKGSHILKDKAVLELGSGPGLVGFAAAKLGAKKVVLSDYKRRVMQLVGYNILKFADQNSGTELAHSQLDWYYATDSKYLEETPLLDGNMQPIGQSTQDFIANDLDLIIGSDLLYFEDSVEPLFDMISHFLKQRPATEFYMCMVRRSQELHNRLDKCLESHPELAVSQVDPEYISELAKDLGAPTAYLFKVRLQP